MVENLCADLGCDDASARERALFRARIEPSGRNEDHCLAVARLLGSDDHHHRDLAAQALLAMECSHRSLLPLVLPGLHDPCQTVRENLIRILLRFEPDDSMRAEVKPLLADASLRVRLCAASWWWKATGASSDVMPIVQEGLSSPGEDEVIRACQLALEFVAERDRFIPRLRELAASGNEAVRGNAAYALLQLGEDRCQLLPLVPQFEQSGSALLGYLASRIKDGAPR